MRCNFLYETKFLKWSKMHSYLHLEHSIDSIDSISATIQLCWLSEFVSIHEVMVSKQLFMERARCLKTSRRRRRNLSEHDQMYQTRLDSRAGGKLLSILASTETLLNMQPGRPFQKGIPLSPPQTSSTRTMQIWKKNVIDEYKEFRELPFILI